MIPPVPRAAADLFGSAAGTISMPKRRRSRSSGRIRSPSGRCVVAQDLFRAKVAGGAVRPQRRSRRAGATGNPHFKTCIEGSREPASRRDPKAPPGCARCGHGRSRLTAGRSPAVHPDRVRAPRWSVNFEIREALRRPIASTSTPRQHSGSSPDRGLPQRPDPRLRLLIARAYWRAVQDDAGVARHPGRPPRRHSETANPIETANTKPRLSSVRPSVLEEPSSSAAVTPW